MESKESLEDLYSKICNINNLFLAFAKVKKGKTKRRYAKRFQRNLKENLGGLREEPINETYVSY